jgi:hypothetical protein
VAETRRLAAPGRLAFTSQASTSVFIFIFPAAFFGSSKTHAAIAGSTRNLLVANTISTTKIARTITLCNQKWRLFLCRGQRVERRYLQQRLHHTHKTIQIKREHGANHVRSAPGPSKMKCVAAKNREYQNTKEMIPTL